MAILKMLVCVLIGAVFGIWLTIVAFVCGVSRTVPQPKPHPVIVAYMNLRRIAWIQ
jgi:hypothetical protein